MQFLNPLKKVKGSLYNRMNLQKDQKLILAVIPARGGSKELKRKSLLKINNKSLISYAIKSSLSSKYINRTIFSSDDDEMILEAKKMALRFYLKGQIDLRQTQPILGQL